MFFKASQTTKNSSWSWTYTPDQDAYGFSCILWISLHPYWFLCIHSLVLYIWIFPYRKKRLVRRTYTSVVPGVTCNTFMHTKIACASKAKWLHETVTFKTYRTYIEADIWLHQTIRLKMFLRSFFSVTKYNLRKQLDVCFLLSCRRFTFFAAFNDVFASAYLSSGYRYAHSKCKS